MSRKTEEKRAILDSIFRIRDRRTSATVIEVNGNHAKVRVGQSTTYLNHVEITGDPTTLRVGQGVELKWVDREGSPSKVPVIVAGGTDVVSSDVGTSVVSVDNITIEYANKGLRVKENSIGMKHIDFDPALDGHTHNTPFETGTWQFTDDGILYTDKMYIHPDGLIKIAPTGAIMSNPFDAGQEGFRINGDVAEFNNVYVRGELHSAVFVYDEIHATAGTFGVFKSAGVLLNDFTSVASPTTFNVDIKDPDTGHVALFAANDILRVKDGSGADNWLKVSSVSDQTTFYRYVCTLENSGTPSTFKAGAAVIDYGQSGDGAVILTADSAESPNLEILTHAGAPYTTMTTQARLGNLRNSYNAGANDYYGFGVGDYSSGDYISYNADGAGKFLISSGGGDLIIDEDGITLDMTSIGSEDTKRVKFVNSSGDTLGHIEGYLSGGTNNAFRFHSTADPGTNKETDISLDADGHVIISSKSNSAFDISLISTGSIHLSNGNGVFFDLTEDVKLYRDSSTTLRTNINFRVDGDLWADGINLKQAGTAVTSGEIVYGQLVSRPGSTNYSVYGFRVLTSEIASSSFWGTGKGDTTGSLYTASTEFSGVPSEATALALSVTIKYGTAGGYIRIGTSSSSGDNVVQYVQNTSQYNSNAGIVSLDGSGRLWVKTSASDMEIWLRCTGYFI